MKAHRDHWLLTIAGMLIGISVVFRILSISHSNLDLEVYNLVWYETIANEGIGKILSTNFTNYNPPYTYLLALATLFKGIVSPLIAIKLIPQFFDIVATLFVFKIVRIKYMEGYIATLASALYFAAPTIILNSAFWGQIDSIYTAFVLICLYYLLKRRNTIALISYGLAISIKAQAIFLSPLLLLLLLQKQIKLRDFVFIPAAYLAAILPVIILGRPILDVLSVYINQASTYENLSRNAPNLYTFMPASWYTFAFPVGTVVAVLLISVWLYYSTKSASPLDIQIIIFHALISVFLTPFFLPKMHDRYFYAADVLTIVFAFLLPRMWFIPILVQLSSTLAYSVFLFNADPVLVGIGTIINTITLAALLREQTKNASTPPMKLQVFSIMSWVTSLLVSLVLIGAGIRLIFTPLFLRLEYNLPFYQASGTELTKSERFQRGTYILAYITGHKELSYLRRLQDATGTALLNSHNRQQLTQLKQFANAAFGAWNMSLLSLFILGILSWIFSDLYTFWNSVKRGGRISVWLAPMTGIILLVLLLNADPSSVFSQTDGPIASVFPARLWIEAVFSLTVMASGAGLLIGYRQRTHEQI